ncbi:MAG: TrmH family RNA methyltransferase [Mariprofundales bacterium]
MLDGLTCQHNIGSILRMADAILVQKVFLCGKNEMNLSRKLRKGSRGSEKWVAWEYQPQVQDVLTTLKAKGVAIVAVELCDRSIAYTDLNAMMPVCFVFGGERKGVSQEALAMADDVVQLPMLE